MTKPHVSLSPRTNMFFITCWAAVATILLYLMPSSARLQLAGTGIVLGLVNGTLQHLSFKEAKTSFIATSSFMDVSQAFRSTKSGLLFIRFLRFSKILLILTAIVVCGYAPFYAVIGYLASYFSLMFVREMITFPDCVALAKMSHQKISTE